MSAYIPSHFFDTFSITAPPLSIQDIGQQNKDFSDWLLEQFDLQDTENLVRARAQYVDLVLSKLWCQHQLDEYQVSLLAVGGYGRAELHPHSDVDILLLTQKKVDKALEEKIGQFITQLWDIRLDIGHSVRDVQECLKQAVNDVTIATNLMEMRLISGCRNLYEQLQPLLQQDVFWRSDKFFIAKRDEQKKRHEQYHGAAYTLEPNLKANPGGLRDIQTIAWVAKRHFLADSMEELVDHEYLTRNEYYELLECQDYLWRMRFALHYVAKRSENRLLFDYQADVAKMMGFGDHGKKAVEKMMKRFFRLIARVAELNKMLLHRFERTLLGEEHAPNVIVIDDDFVVEDGLMKITRSRLFSRPVKIMEMFLKVAQTPEVKDLHPETLRLLRNARRRLISRLNDYQECRRMFVELVRHPRGLGLAFNLMHRHSILGAYLPQWRHIVGQMQFDLFHAYSVDEHSYRLIKNLYRFSQAEHNHEFPLCSKIVQRTRKPELLYFAGIFHDIAKGRGGDHAKLGAIDALEFAEEHGLNKHDGRMIAWLVEQHLLMSVTAQRKDISDETVIKEFAEVVRDEARLDLLYCLTVADMRATNESLWNSWKANLLEELYNSTKRAFRLGLEKPVDLRAKIRENQAQALELLTERELSEENVKACWKHFKSDYFLRYTPDQIKWHTRNIITKQDDGPMVLISPKPYRGGTEVFVYTKEQPHIFARTVALLGNKKLSIHDAKIITSKNGYTLNTFVILDQRNKPIDDTHRAQEIVDSITRILCKESTAQIPVQPVSKKNKQFVVNTVVNYSKTNSKNRTMLEIIAMDRPGLLASIGQVFQDLKIHIHSAKITTFGERAEDVFTVSNDQGTTLTEVEQEQLRQRLCDDLV